MTESPAPLADDGLTTAEVGPWADEKYRLVTLYAQLFARAMAGKWESLCYVDLFAGPGRCRLTGSSRIELTSATRILNLPDRFHRYVFCDIDAPAARALRTRAERDHADRNVTVLSGDANEIVAEVLGQVPARGSLSFCFLDPWKMKNLRFATIRELATRRMDFLVLIPSGMDSHRNESRYRRADNRVVEAFCGAPDWRDRWSEAKQRNERFEAFVVAEFSRSMAQLGYLDLGLERTHIVRMDEKNVLLYRLAFFSKSEIGNRLWAETRKYSSPQMGLRFD